MSKYKGKKALIVGFGRSGVAVAQYLCKQGARVVVTDMKQKSDLTESIKACSDLKIEYDLGKHTPRYFHEADLIVVSPGVPLDIRPLEEARDKNIPITNEVDLAAVALKEPLIAVTGTNGKTTTTTLLGELFKADRRPSFVGGNIGNPLLNHVIDGSPVEFVVAELSSFQLELTEKLVPAVAIFTNIEQDHLDRYPNMDTYILAKKKLLKACDRNSYVVLNYDDPVVSRFAHETPARLAWFTCQDPIEIGGEFAERFCGVYYDEENKRIVDKITSIDEIYDVTKLRLFGRHNKENLMAAICAARSLGVSPHAIRSVIASFEGVEHRLEFVRKKNGVYIFNDSKATNIMSVHRSLTSFKKNPIILIAGGKDKDSDFAPLANVVQDRCKMLILIGEAKEKINRALGDYAETFLVGTFEEAVLMSYQKSRSGDIILLSPGCSSYDMFRNFEERGDYFKKLVTQL